MKSIWLMSKGFFLIGILIISSDSDRAWIFLNRHKPNNTEITRIHILKIFNNLSRNIGNSYISTMLASQSLLIGVRIMTWTVWANPTCILTVTIPNGNVNRTWSMGKITVGRSTSGFLNQVTLFKNVSDSSRTWILLNTHQSNFSHVLWISYRIVKYWNIIGRNWSLILSILSNEFRHLINIISMLLDQVDVQSGLLRYSIWVFEQSWILSLYLRNSNPRSTEWLITCLN